MARANRNRKANKKVGPSNKRPKGFRGTAAEKQQAWLAQQQQRGFSGKLLHRL